MGILLPGLCHSIQTFTLLLSAYISTHAHSFLLVKTTINLIVLQNICCHNVGILSGASCDSFKSILFIVRVNFVFLCREKNIDFDLNWKLLCKIWNSWKKNSCINLFKFLNKQPIQPIQVYLHCKLETLKPMYHTDDVNCTKDDDLLTGWHNTWFSLLHFEHDTTTTATI